MLGQNYFLITALPSLGELGTPPALTPMELLEHLGDEPAKIELLKTIFLSDDLLQHQAFLAGEITELDLCVLSDPQGRNEEPLPDYLVSCAPRVDRHVPADDLWAGYFCYVAGFAHRRKIQFLKDWVGYELALRNALAVARAKALQLNPDDYLVSRDLSGPEEEEFTGLLNEWAAAPTPLEGQRVLDKGRWGWLQEHDGWFSFKDDELAAYAVRLTLLNRWHRLAQNEPKGSD